MMNEITSDRTALFLQRGMGNAPMFRGMHVFTGDMRKADGAITPIYHFDAGRPVPIGRTRAAPEPVSVTLDASLRAIGDLVGDRANCPIHLTMIADTCLSADLMRSWGRWGSTEPQLMLLIQDAQIEERSLSNLMSRDGNGNLLTGAVQIKFDKWSLIKGGTEVSIEDEVGGASLVSLTHSNRLDCDAIEFGGAETCLTWYAATSNGALWKRSGEEDWSPVTVSSPWVTNNGGIYADNRFLLVGGSDGVGGSYGVLRSTNGGTTWTKVAFASSGSTDEVRQIARYNDDFFAFTSTGIWRSVDKGKSWSVARSGSALRGTFDGIGLGAAINRSKVFISRDSGLRWAQVNQFGESQKDAAFGGGYLHVVDDVAGYARADVSALRHGTAPDWEVKDTTTGITRIVFASSQLGYRLRGTVIERTLNGGYSWEAMGLDSSAAAFTEMMTCGGRLGVIGGRYFGYYSPFFDGEA